MAPEVHYRFVPWTLNGRSSIMGLRLWIRRRDSCGLSPTSGTHRHCRLKYADFVPEAIDKTGEKVEKLDAVIDRINCEIESGRLDQNLVDVITIETLQFPTADDWKLEDQVHNSNNKHTNLQQQIERTQFTDCRVDLVEGSDLPSETLPFTHPPLLHDVHR